LPIYDHERFEYLLLVRFSIFFCCYYLLLILFYLNQGALFRFRLFIHSLMNLVMRSVGVTGVVCLKYTLCNAIQVQSQ